MSEEDVAIGRVVVLAVVPDVRRRDPRVVECPDARGDKGGIVTIGDDEKAEGRKDDGRRA